MNILSIDPGIRTGVAFKAEEIYKTFEVLTYPNVWQIVSSGNWTAVVCENFTAQDISKYGITTVRIIGGIEALCTLREIPLFIQQNISRLPYKPRALELLKQIHGGKKPPRDHELDALAHLLKWEHDYMHMPDVQRRVQGKVSI